MKRLIVTALLLMGMSAALFSQNTDEIKNYILQSELMFFSPSCEELITNIQSVMKRFYGKNYEQMKLQVSSNAKSVYGVDVMDLESMRAAGVDLKQPIAYVHLSNQAGYLLIPIASKKTAENFIQKNLGKTKPHQFLGNYLIFSQNPQIITAVATNKNRLETNPGFAVALSKLNFKWNKLFAWIESRYFSVVSSSIGVSANMKIPYGFTAFTVDFYDQQVSIKNYSGILSSNQNEYVRNLRNVSASQKFELLDFIWGNPAVVGNVYMNMPMLYQYYSYIDSINILGIKGFFGELWDKYRINVERDLINNSDGRLKLVLNQFDTTKNSYVFYGSLGIKSTDIANTFMESVKSAVIQSSNKLYSFDIFTKPFYHYESSNYSLYYGIIENDFVFATDKDILVQLAKNIFENKGGFLETAPSFLKDSTTESKVGYFFTIDVQSLFSNIKTGFEIKKEFLVGVKEINIYGNPDLDDKPYGWNTTIDINFYN